MWKSQDMMKFEFLSIILLQDNSDDKIVVIVLNCCLCNYKQE